MSSPRAPLSSALMVITCTGSFSQTVGSKYLRFSVSYTCCGHERCGLNERRLQPCSNRPNHFEQRRNRELILSEERAPNVLPRWIVSKHIRQTDRQNSRDRHPPPLECRSYRPGQGVCIERLAIEQHPDVPVILQPAVGHPERWRAVFPI